MDQKACINGIERLHVTLLPGRKRQLGPLVSLSEERIYGSR